MSKVNEAGPQDQFVDDQTIDVDIDKIYNNFISEIDKTRSHVSVQNNPDLNNITNIKSSDSPINVNQEQDPQESRCHAFYRLLGLPVTDGISLYTPGFDLLNNSNTTELDKKKNIDKKIFENKDLKALLNKREDFPRSFLSAFGAQDVTAMVLAMSTAEPRRPINTPFNKVSGIFDTDDSNQKYDNDLSQRLLNTVTNNGGAADANLINNSKYHILVPLIVDPRIDSNVYPKRCRLSVPFVKDKTEAMLSDGIYLKRPYIEKVCRARFDIRDLSITLGDNTNNIINSIKSNKDIKDNALIQKVFDPNKITSETTQFANYLNAIRSVLRKLYDSVSKITPVLAADPNSNGGAKFNWTPIPNKKGPENGCTTRDLLTGQSDDPHNTDNDKNLLLLLYKQSISNIKNSLNHIQDPDPGGFAFNGVELTPDSTSSDGMQDLIQSPIDDATNQRTKACDLANDAVRTIEIIMGTFSGLGLLDILVISSAFWVVEKKDLLGLLDNTAINRMLDNANLQAAEVQARQANPPNPGDSLLNFQNRVKEIYDIAAKFWEQIQNENIR